MEDVVDGQKGKNKAWLSHCEDVLDERVGAWRGDSRRWGLRPDEIIPKRLSRRWKLVSESFVYYLLTVSASLVRRLGLRKEGLTR
ncbi:hypothetical protein Csa_004674 [Cucumis sativus]|uniref:Uncharacterized protein n=1 Tax=Cucumis sativus TaxID=3659 RepID=A0A0A0KLQ5_CUCSA|nr:hypothetical protein Csa_004674 [Cucumis sativus]